METPLNELLERLKGLETLTDYDIGYKRGADMATKVIIEVIKQDFLEAEKQMIIEAFRDGRKTGAIFKSQKDNEGLAEQYYTDNFKG